MSTRPDFSKVDFTAPCIEKETKEQWAARVKAETGMSVEELVTHTMEQIDVQPNYTRADIKDAVHTGYTAGLPPFLRGPYPTMYVTRPWTVRQYAVSPPRKNPMHFIGATLPPVRRAFQ